MPNVLNTNIPLQARGPNIGNALKAFSEQRQIGQRNALLQRQQENEVADREFRKSEAEANRTFRQSEAVRAQSNTDRSFNLAERGLKLKETAADRKRKVTDFFLGKLMDGRKQGVSVTGTISQSSAPSSAQEAAALSLASGDVSGAAKLLMDAEQNSPRAVSNRAEAQALGTGFAKQRNKIQESGQRAQKRLFTIEALEKANQKATTGAFSGGRLTAGRVLNAFGVDPGTFGINPNLPASEFMNSQSLNVVLDFIAQTKGAISEREMDTFANASPGLQNSRAGNEVMLRVMRAVAERERHIAQGVSKLGAGQFNASVLNQIQQEAQRAVPFPSLTIQDADAGGGSQSQLRELLLEKQRRSSRSQQADVVGF